MQAFPEGLNGSEGQAKAWPEPVNIFREIVPKRFEFDEVPAPIADLARAVTASRGHDQSGMIVAATVAAAAAIDDRYRLIVRSASDWFDPLDCGPC